MQGPCGGLRHARIIPIDQITDVIPSLWVAYSVLSGIGSRSKRWSQLTRCRAQTSGSTKKTKEGPITDVHSTIFCAIVIFSPFQGIHSVIRFPSAKFTEHPPRKGRRHRQDVLATLHCAACSPLRLQADQSTSTDGQLQKREQILWTSQRL
jgi:hypothetical protein